MENKIVKIKESQIELTGYNLIILSCLNTASKLENNTTER